MSLIVLFLSRTVLVERLIASSPRTSGKDFINVFDTRVRYSTIELDTLDVIVDWQLATIYIRIDAQNFGLSAKT